MTPAKNFNRQKHKNSRKFISKVIKRSVLSTILFSLCSIAYGAHFNTNQSCDDFDIAYIDDETLAVFQKDYGWSGAWNFVCLNGSCHYGERKDGYFIHEFPAELGSTYNISVKIQDDAIGEYMAEKEDLIFSNNSCF